VLSRDVVEVTLTKLGAEQSLPFATRYAVTPTASVAWRRRLTLVELVNAFPLLIVTDPTGAIASDAAPVPLTGTMRPLKTVALPLGSEAFTWRLAERDPTAPGVKVTLKVKLAAMANDVPTAGVPLTVKSAGNEPDLVTDRNVMAASPLLVTVNVWGVDVVLVATLPKSFEAGLVLRLPTAT